MSSPSPILVTGAAGQLGRRVLELLLERNAGPLLATTRDPQKLAGLAGVDVRAADFDRPDTLPAAFRGAKAALLISTDSLATPGQRLAQHRAAIAAFVAAGVERVVYTSLTGADHSSVTFAPDHAGTEQALRDSGLDYVVLRNNLYADLWLHSLPRAVATGQLVDARGDGRAAFVTREDCARAAASALLADEGGRKVLEVTGSEALTSAEVAALVTAISGRPVAHRSIGVAEVRAGLLDAGLPAPFADAYASFDAAIAKGEFSRPSSAVRDLTGAAPGSLRAFLTETRDVWSGAGT